MLFFNANFICYYFYPTKKREEPIFYHIAIRYTKIMHKKTAQNSHVPFQIFLLWLSFYRIRYMHTFEIKIPGKSHIPPVPIIV